MKMKTMKLAVFFAAIFLVIGCASGAKAGTNDGGLDAAMRKTSDYLNERIPQGSKVVFLNVKSDWPDLSEYILSGLSENAVNDGVFSVVDRQQLDAIRSELNFQWSGEVSDKSAQEIGQMLGAQTIVSGAVTTLGDEYRIQVRAIAVQTAAVQGQTTQTADGKGKRVVALTKKVVPAGSGGTSTASGTRTQTGTTTASPSSAGGQGGQQAQPAPAQTANFKNGTYSFYPRPRAMLEGRDTDTYLEKIVVRGGYFIVYFSSVKIGLSKNNPSIIKSWHWRKFSAVIQDLDKPSRTVTSTNYDRVEENGGTYAIWTFANHNIRRISFKSICESDPKDTEYHFIFEEIDMSKAEYEP